MTVVGAAARLLREVGERRLRRDDRDPADAAHRLRRVDEQVLDDRLLPDHPDRDGDATSGSPLLGLIQMPQMPRHWVWMQVAILVFVLAGIVIAIAKLS